MALTPGNSAAYEATGADIGVVVGAKVRVEPAKGSKLKKWHCAKVLVSSERDPSIRYIMQLNDWVQVSSDLWARDADLCVRRVRARLT